MHNFFHIESSEIFSGLFKLFQACSALNQPIRDGFKIEKSEFDLLFLGEGFDLKFQIWLGGIFKGEVLKTRFNLWEGCRSQKKSIVFWFSYFEPITNFMIQWTFPRNLVQVTLYLNRFSEDEDLISYFSWLLILTYI